MNKIKTEFEPIPDECQVCGSEVNELGVCDNCDIGIFNTTHTVGKIEDYLIEKHKL